jgi:hypothetical protein
MRSVDDRTDADRCKAACAGRSKKSFRNSSLDVSGFGNNDDPTRQSFERCRSTVYLAGLSARSNDIWSQFTLRPASVRFPRFRPDQTSNRLSQQGTDPNKISGLDAEQRSQRTSAKLRTGPKRGRQLRRPYSSQVHSPHLHSNTRTVALVSG